MNSSPDGIRKVAILIQTLDREAADLVLDQLADDEAERVRRAVFDLDPLDPAEQRRVIDEFLRAAPQRPVVWHGRFQAEAVGGTPAAGTPRAFQSLGEISPDGLTGALATERPQTIAMVLSHLAPALAGEVLVRFPSRIQTEVLRRLVDLEETDPEILAEIEQSLRCRPSHSFDFPLRRVSGLAAVEGILDAADRQVGSQLYQNLSAHDPPLAERLRPERMEFEDLAQIDRADLEDLLDATDLKLLALALVGAPPAVVDRLLAALPPARAAVLSEEMDHPGPTRLSDVEAAREWIGLIAQKLGIRSPRSAGRRGRRLPASPAGFCQEA
ncbi:MAG: FliG C-terminal domain-containing protein [Planctomycetota bacterium]|nr:FliG C-terminal domain-containing protein [Planctomycetota bacterium]